VTYPQEIKLSSNVRNDHDLEHLLSKHAKRYDKIINQILERESNHTCQLVGLVFNGTSGKISSVKTTNDKRYSTSGLKLDFKTFKAPFKNTLTLLYLHS